MIKSRLPYEKRLEFLGRPEKKDAKSEISYRFSRLCTVEGRLIGSMKTKYLDQSKI